MFKNHLTSTVVLVVALTTHIATSSTEAETGFQQDIQEQNLEGIINGVDWVFGSGVALFDAADDEYLVRLYAETSENPCTLQSSVNKIVLSLPNQVGPYPLALDGETDTLVEDRDEEAPMNYIAVTGNVEVYSIEADVLAAAMAVYVDDNTWVNGTFDITICD